MPRYGAVWLEIAREQYTSLAAEAREQIDTRVEQLLENSPAASPLRRRRAHRPVDHHLRRRRRRRADRLRRRPRPTTGDHPAAGVVGPAPARLQPAIGAWHGLSVGAAVQLV